MPVAWPFLLILLILPLNAVAQSSCLFMRDTPFDLDSMPKEPLPGLSTLKKALTKCLTTFSTKSHTLPTFKWTHTCCTSQIELEMEHFARLAVDRFVHDHLILLRQSFDEFARDFRSKSIYLKAFRFYITSSNPAVRSTQKQLDRMFTQTYGPFYAQNTKIFTDFFDELDEQFAVEQTQSSSGVKNALATLFRKIFITEFSLMNPLRKVGDTERYCMSRIQTQIRPFGNLPAKVASQLDRAFNLWKQVTQSLEKASIVLLNVADKLTASSECTSALVRLRECHLCSGVSPEARPCLGFCLNVLRGCYADVAEIEPQWSDYIDSLQQLTARLKSASNPFTVMAPMPVQISEAIMMFQEKGHQLSNRIIFQCFEPLFRLKRSINDENPLNEKPVIVEDKGGQSLADFFEQEYKKADQIKRSVSLFTDRLGRMKGAWRLLSTAICVDGQLAAPSGEQCWNGEKIAPYKRLIVSSGISSQKRNPEFGKELKVSRETFIEERIKFATMARQLNQLYGGHSKNKQDFVEGSALEDLHNPDDEDSFEGSAYDRDDLPDEYRDPEDIVNIHLLEQRRERSLADSRRFLCLKAVFLFLLLRLI
ncbi:Dally-like protein [Aphelenchoides bicaudatus]|nr:Dally-like protein [Aphelenchoides bicaudatus]